MAVRTAVERGHTLTNAVGGVHGAGDNSSTAGQRCAASCTASQPDGTRLRGGLAVPAEGGRVHCRLLRSLCGGGGCGGLSKAIGEGALRTKGPKAFEVRRRVVSGAPGVAASVVDECRPPPPLPAAAPR
ncbi:uncharacterized protein Tco025E_09369 [Trypanosoma conorhini]|uniref:Uncharacterized protein n=1 Tax=Trypanosoma conorhini TaxID=83891 RepID=A0A3R7JWH6_9TRYP|nr:uncharacterized protein Tco025E_09369 [Trypanosoma conorhini]RNE97936.1 hypothetical protein Tco025E_09369 [Trypanosoma conorhini]